MLAPTFGLPLNGMAVVPNGSSFPWYLAYMTEERVVGLCKLPLDGNPNKTMGLIAHPRNVTALCVSNDGQYLFTSGGEDLTVNQW